MVKDTLHEKAPDERFSQAVIAGLLARANLLKIPDHPVRKVLDAIRRELSDYEFVDADEVVPTPVRALQDSLGVAYRVDRDRILSFETTISVLRAATGRQPPVRLIAAGRSFRAVGETPWHRKAFHQMDALCIDRGVTLDACVALVRRAARAALGHREVELSEVVNVMWYSRGYRLVTAAAASGPIPIGGFGLLEPEALADLGLDPATVSGFAVDFGLDRLAMLAFGIDDAAKLSQPPYVP